MPALANRDINAQATSNPPSGEKTEITGTENKMQNAQHKQLLGQKKQNTADPNDKQQNGAYISPSDAILSPATQKLAGFKQRQINKQNAKTSTSRMLFGRSPSNSSSGVDDVPEGGQK